MTDDELLESSLRDYRRARRKARLKVAAGLVAFVLLLGALPIPLGLGPFGYRLFRYERVQLHFVNITGETVRVEIGSASGEFPGGRVHEMSFRAGDVRLEVHAEDGRLMEAIDLFVDNQSVFYNLGDGRGQGDCFVLLDASGLYDQGRGGQGRSGPPFEVVERIEATDRIVPIPRGVFIPPRGVAPDSAPGGQRVYWIDDVACELLDPVEENILIAQQVVRMEGRREERRRRLEEARERR